MSKNKTTTNYKNQDYNNKKKHMNGEWNSNKV
jgi:hypothetical protein